MNGEAAGRGAFLPLFLLAVALVGWFIFQATQLVAERNALNKAIAEQETQVEQSKKVRSQLETLATGTARIARSGNANATIIVEELRKRGITIKPDDETAAAPPAATP